MLPEYISAKYLENYVSSELKEKLAQPISYINQNNRLAAGVGAAILPDICDVWIIAREKGALNEDQVKTAERAYILRRPNVSPFSYPSFKLIHYQKAQHFC